MKMISHAELVSALAKPGEQILREMLRVGVCGEAGELIDAIKKAAIYGKSIDRENVKEELGDY